MHRTENKRIKLVNEYKENMFTYLLFVLHRRKILTVHNIYFIEIKKENRASPGPINIASLYNGKENHRIHNKDQEST